MIRTKLYFIFSFSAIALLLSSCFKNEEYPDEPNISDPVLAFLGDSLILTFAFTDGDGDIGLAPEDTLDPYNPDSYYHYNLYIEYFEKDDEEGWAPGLDLDENPIVFKYRLKPIVVKGKARGIKGTMDVTMINYNNPFSDDSDTVKYTVKLIDKALNESNIIETPEIYF